MPYPPPQDDVFKFRFITNYLLAGCFPPFDLIVEFTEKPRLDLLRLFFVPDATDIAQAMFDPRHGRHRKPARHGRKRPKFKGIPDISDMIGERMRVDEVAEAIGDLPGTRMAFRFINAVEGFQIAAAVVEIAEDMAFDPILGTILTKHDHCLEFDRISRRNDGPIVAGFPGPDLYPIPLTILETNHGFFNNPWITSHDGSNWGIGFSASMKYEGSLGHAAGSLALSSNIRGVIAESQVVTLGYQDQTHLSVTAKCHPGEDISWVWKPVYESLTITEAQVIAYGEHGWLDWT